MSRAVTTSPTNGIQERVRITWPDHPNFDRSLLAVQYQRDVLEEGFEDLADNCERATAQLVLIDPEHLHMFGTIRIINKLLDGSALKQL